MKEEQTLHVGAPNIGSRERFFERANKMFDRRWLTNRGELVQEFEQAVADYLGVRHCISMCNGTVALEIAIRALGLSGEVIIPSLTFIATAHALQWQEITPVFCDIDRNTYCIDPAEIEKHITPKTTAIMGVHLYSRPCDIEALQSIADKNGLKLLFDAAHAFGCSHNGRMIGNFGECEVLSFHATKFFNTFEGGAITTNNDELAEKIRLMQNFGFQGMDNVGYIGTNGKMSEICAAMGLVNLEEIGTFLETNRINYTAYRKGLAGIPGLKLIEFNDAEKCNRQYIVVEVGKEYPLSRDELMEKLHAQNIRARRYFWPGCHRMEPYRSLQPNAGMMLPATEEVAERILVLPTGSAVSEETVSNICRLVTPNG
ncbi:dTDP-4-amino-4,6-dideoxy-D-glucose transaminase [Pontiella desulfatans]|uniref:dTDP-4-amino-4,6-dideoxy-D-glucose transaminase n=1 Tax=Pontiella desulfatans TaxID=2750659 RepID=A0A6C2TX74_PONDE|nr:aminotransferase class I/II-fold pyridoxal phosphate-dependent enzyme [Pontiella desulfatans]VGO12278.1 dTDP-4-amino-4,6-dideoxy-D-glucose transaminase [Pontiella desulfatans]